MGLAGIQARQGARGTGCGSGTMRRSVPERMGSVHALQHPPSDNPTQASHGAIAAPWPILRLPDHTGMDGVQVTVAGMLQCES